MRQHMDVVGRKITEPWEGEIYGPADAARVPEVGVLVLAGSSGRIESERARVFAEQGMSALTIRWFGGVGQPESLTEVPLETFTAAVDFLRAHGARRIGIVGVSKGAEAALLTAVHDPRVDVIVAVSPTAYVWSWSDAGKTGSSWSWHGVPLPYVPMDDAWPSEHAHLDAPIAIRDWYERSERLNREHCDAAAIPVERTRAEIVLVAGGDDQMWPSVPYAENLVERRRAYSGPGSDAPIHLVSSADAGHRVRFPGESPAAPPTIFAYGGTHDADARLGADAWQIIVDALLRLPQV